jgi:hypothetical protein
MATFKSDYDFGIASEKTNHTILEKVFKTPFIRRGGKAIFDYDNLDVSTKPTTIYAELKTRRINHNWYPTALIGANKVWAASQNPAAEHWFVYNYMDGIYGIKYDKTVFSGFEHGDFQRGERSDKNDKPQDCYFIPYKSLIKLI